MIGAIAYFSACASMLGVVAIVEDRAENLRMQRLHAPAEERRESGHLPDVVRRNAVLLRDTACVPPVA